MLPDRIMLFLIILMPMIAHIHVQGTSPIIPSHVKATYLALTDDELRMPQLSGTSPIIPSHVKATYLALTDDEFRMPQLSGTSPIEESQEFHGETTFPSGVFRYPLNGEHYYNNEKATLVIKTADPIKITFISFDISDAYGGDYLIIYDGDKSESNVLGNFTGDNVPGSVQTSTNTAHLQFIANELNPGRGFELYYEPRVDTFYQIPKHSDYEVRLNFSANPRPTDLKWSYGANFQEMPNLIQIPSDNGKFSTSLTDLENGNYQAILRITTITEEDYETNFKLHVTSEVGETHYRVTLSAFPPPPSNFKISNIMPTSVQLTWNYDVNPGDISYYVIMYKTRDDTQDYSKISGIGTKFYTVRGLTPSTEYEFHVLAVHKIGHGPPSDFSYATTSKTGCGGEYNSGSGMIHYQKSSGKPYYDEKCTWIIRAAIGSINITFDSIDIGDFGNKFYIRDGESIESNLLGEFTGGDYVPKSVQTITNAAHLLLTAGLSVKKVGFELHWESVDAPIQTFYGVHVHRDYEVRLNFSANPQPTALEWFYGPNFQEMPNLIHIPSDNGKLSTSLIDLENGKYQALLKISGITVEELESKFKFHVANEIGEANYKVILSECPEGFIMSNGSKQCFKIFKDKMRNWEAAKMKCAEEGLTLAKPTDAVAVSLIKDLLDTYGNVPVWLDTCSDWTKFVWNLDKHELSKEDRTIDICLALLVKEEVWTDYPGRLYGPLNCSYPLNTLCETSSSLLNVPACGGLFTPVGDSCLLLAMTEKLTWASAREYCQTLGADLVVFKDANHYADTLGYIWRVSGENTTIDLWVGGSDEAVEGQWVSVTGGLMPQGPPFWGSDSFVAEPSGGRTENCAGLHHHDRYYMHDFSCSLKHAPVCQKIPVRHFIK